MSPGRWPQVGLETWSRGSSRGQSDDEFTRSSRLSWAKLIRRVLRGRPAALPLLRRRDRDPQAPEARRRSRHERSEAVGRSSPPSSISPPPRRSVKASSSQPKSPSLWLTRLPKRWSSLQNPPEPAPPGPAARPRRRCVCWGLVGSFTLSTTDLETPGAWIYPSPGRSRCAHSQQPAPQQPFSTILQAQYPRCAKTNLLLLNRIGASSRKPLLACAFSSP
jgi:hypothetical protein